MKRILLLLAFTSALSSGFAQSPIGDGGKQVNFGVGLYSRSLPLYLGMDFGIHPDITIGPQIGFDLYLDYLAVSGRGDYHFNSLLDIPRDWDFYAGLNIGFVAFFEEDYRDRNRPYYNNRNRATGLDLGLQIGGRYYWNESWAINLEFGGGPYFSGGRFGLSKRF